MSNEGREQESLECERLKQGSGKGEMPEPGRLEKEWLQQKRGEQVKQGQRMELWRGAFQKLQAKEAEQRKRLRDFDRELFSYTGQIAWLVPGIFSFAVLGLMCIPVQEIECEDNYLRVMLFMVCVMIPYFVLLPYVNISDAFERPRNNRNMTYDKLKYLPISRKQYILVRMGYLLRYVWKLALAGGVVQCIFALGTMGRVELVNVAYAAGVLLLMPLAVGWIQMNVFSN